MGNSSQRFDTSFVTEGTPDANGRASSIMNVVQRTDNYFLFFYLGTTTSIINVPFVEYRNGGTFYINGNTSTPQNLEICLVDSYKACPVIAKTIVDTNTNAIISPNKIYFENPSTPCSSYIYRLGSVVSATSAVSTQTAQNGFLCKVSVGDFKETKEAESTCCRSSHIPFNTFDANRPLLSIYETFRDYSITNPRSCPMSFSNGYSSNHCNIFMDDYCKINANTDACIMYMIATLDKQINTLETFIEYCSEHITDRVCLHMAIAARNLNQPEVPDRALRQYCSRYPTSKNCECYNTSIRLPNNFKQNSYVGPIACWYKPCAENTSLQLLTTEMLQQRKGCNITKCSIDVGNINLNSANPSLVTLINDCQLSSVITSDIDDNFFADQIWSSGNMGLLIVGLPVFFIALSFIISSYKL